MNWWASSHFQLVVIISWVKADLEALGLVNHLQERPQGLQEGKVPLVTAGPLAAPFSPGHLELPFKKKSPLNSIWFKSIDWRDGVGWGEVDSARLGLRRLNFSWDQKWWSHEHHMKPWIHSVRREVLCQPCLCLTGGPWCPPPPELQCPGPRCGVGWGCNLRGASSWGSPQLAPHWRSSVSAKSRRP